MRVIFLSKSRDMNNKSQTKNFTTRTARCQELFSKNFLPWSASRFIIPLLLEMPLQAPESHFKPLLQQYFILKWDTRAWQAVVASHCVSCALETRTQFLHRIFTIISILSTQLYLVCYLLDSSLTSSILPKYQDPIFPKDCEDYVKALEYSARSGIVTIVRWMREYRESQLIAG